MSKVVSTATLFSGDLRTNPGLLPYLVGYGCQSLALVHTTTQHSRDWCIGLLTEKCQESYAPITSMLGSRVHQSERLATIPNEVWDQTRISTEIIGE